MEEMFWDWGLPLLGAVVFGYQVVAGLITGQVAVTWTKRLLGGLFGDHLTTSETSRYTKQYEPIQYWAVIVLRLGLAAACLALVFVD